MRKLVRHVAAFTLGSIAVVVSLGAATAQELKKVTYAIATADLNVGYPFATLAKHLGYFKEEGLDVSIVPGQSSAATVQLLLTGRADVGVAQPDPVMIQRANANIPLISFYPVSRRGTNVLIVKDGSPLQSLKDIKGKKVGVGDLGSASVNYLKSRLGEEGMALGDVSLVATGYGTPGFEALKGGTTDMAVSFNGGVARMTAAGYKVRVLPQPESERDLYTYNLFATSDYIRANPDVIKGIGRATAKATVYLKNNPEAAVRAFWAYAPDRAPKDPNDKAAMERDITILKAQIVDMAADTLPDDFAWGSQDAAIYAKAQDYLMKVEQIKAPKDPSIYFDNTYAADYVKFDAASVAAASKAAK